MAITLNRHAARCVEIAIERGKIDNNSSSAVFRDDISRNWRLLLDATNFPSEVLSGWNEKEELSAEIIIAAISYLKHIGCSNIEQLLRDAIELHEKRDK